MKRRTLTREERIRIHRTKYTIVLYAIVLALLGIGIMIGVSIGAAAATDKVTVTYRVALDGAVTDRFEVRK